LGPRIVKFTGLANDDRASTKDQYTFEVGTFRHVGYPIICGCVI
jgi:hypothetical protein